MNIHRTHIIKSAALAMAIAAAAQPAFSEEHGVIIGNHHFVYYRDHDIYFAPESNTYYWMSDGTWQSGPVLPEEDQRYITSGGVDIQLDTAVPYTRHAYVVSHYKNADPTTQTTTTKRSYVYYGDHDIYFAPETNVYYWKSNGTWQSGTALPPEDRTFVQKGGVTIELDTDRPYTKHEYVVAHYKHRHDRYDDERHDDDR